MDVFPKGIADAVDILLTVHTQPGEQPPPAGTRLETLQFERKVLVARRRHLSRIRGLYTSLGLLSAVAGTIIYVWAGLPPIISYTMWGYAALLIVSPLLTDGRMIENDLLTISFELDLLEHDNMSPELRAEKLFKQHQLELKKYYDQTLKHSSKIFHIGVLCIAVGFGIVGLTLYLLMNQLADKFEEKVLVAVLGAIGGILSNFIGVVYMRMFSEILKSVTDFHNRLVATHNLYFSNFMLSKVQDISAKDAVTGEIARALSVAASIPVGRAGADK
jgi:hypothetical protein